MERPPADAAPLDDVRQGPVQCDLTEVRPHNGAHQAQLKPYANALKAATSRHDTRDAIPDGTSETFQPRSKECLVSPALAIRFVIRQPPARTRMRPDRSAWWPAGGIRLRAPAPARR